MTKTSKMKLRRMLLASLLCLLSVTSWSQIPKYEVRAVWLTTIKSLDWPQAKATSATGIEQQKRQLCDILDRLHRSNVNTILLQTRVRATTIYPSNYEPWDACLTGKGGNNPGYDPLQFAIDECHKRGMELHAWVVSIPVGKWNDIGCKRLRERYPSMIHKIGDEGYMNPEQGQTAEYIGKICREIVEKYDVDGIHLDYIRYPENWKIRVSRQQGRDHITRIVRAVNHQVKSLKPWVKISCSPIGKSREMSRFTSRGWNAYDAVCQDAQGWLRDGLMDQLYPMMYFKDDNFYPFAVDWAWNTYGRTVAPGLGIWMMSRTEGSNWSLMDITREMNVLRSLGMGHTYFRSRFFTDNLKGIYTYAKDKFDQYPSLTPPMTWQSTAIPSRPEGMNMTSTAGKLVLRWWGGTDTSGSSSYIMYNVYTSKVSPVDVTDGRNLIARRLRHPQLVLANDDGEHFFAITAIDRYGNESAPLQSKEPYKSNVEWLKNDGNQLSLPPIDPTLDVYYICVESMQGNVLMTRIKTPTLNIRSLPNGVYSLKAMNRQKKSFHIGQFIIKR